MLISYFAATDRAVLSFLSSILRGVIAIVLCAVVLSRIWGMTGIWLAFLTSELITLGITILVQGIAKSDSIDYSPFFETRLFLQIFL